MIRMCCSWFTAFLDYEELVAVPLTLSISEPFSCVNISLRADMAIESTEVFSVAIESPDEALNLIDASATVTIVDTTMGQFDWQWTYWSHFTGVKNF